MVFHQCLACIKVDLISYHEPHVLLYHWEKYVYENAQVTDYFETEWECKAMEFNRYCCKNLKSYFNIDISMNKNVVNICKS